MVCVTIDIRRRPKFEKKKIKLNTSHPVAQKPILGRFQFKFLILTSSDILYEKSPAICNI